MEKYRYLGLVLTEFLDYAVMARNVAAAAGRALGLLIAKSKAHGGMPYECFSHLYDALVQSVINYGAAVWGDRELSCIGAVQNRASRYFLGLGKYAPTAAVRGDMGWSTPSHRQWLAVTRQWCRLVNMNGMRLNKRIFTWAHDKGGPRCKNWVFRVQQFYRHDRLLHMDHMANVDYDFNTAACTRDIDEVLHEHYEVLWVAEVARVAGRNNVGRNKLRTYRQFKAEFTVEPYVQARKVLGPSDFVHC